MIIEILLLCRLSPGFAICQGLIAERVPIHADTGVHPNLLNSRFGYVSVSHARSQTTIITNDAPKVARMLGENLSRHQLLKSLRRHPWVRRWE